MHPLQKQCESEFLRHEPCVNCGSSDANSLYSDWHSYCFSCTTYTHPTGEAYSQSSRMSNVQLQGSAQRLQKRGLSEKVCDKYKIFRDGDLLRFYYFSSDGILKGCKVKTKDKDFRYEGDTDGTFFGQHLFPTTGKRVVITEGELDAASCYSAMEGWPMASLPGGAASARKAIQRNLEWLQGYESVVLFYDNDAAGREAAEK